MFNTALRRNNEKGDALISCRSDFGFSVENQASNAGDGRKSRGKSGHGDVGADHSTRTRWRDDDGLDGAYSNSKKKPPTL